MTATPSVTEDACQLGADHHLVGIVTRPHVLRADQPAIVLLNAGVLHRVGPHRLHVRLARHLAEAGFVAMRLDLSGIGDSGPIAGAMTFRESAVADTRAVMDELAAQDGSKRFVLFGLCSGADNALAAASVDDRVAAIVVIDPPAYLTRRSRARQVLSRARELGARDLLAWGAASATRRIRRQLTALTRSRDLDRSSTPEESSGRELPPPEVFGAQLTALADRGVKVLAIHTGALGARYNHADQLFELFPALRGRIDVRYFPDANHMFTERAAQTRLVDTVADWLRRTFA